jgi:hypothetical protein
MLGERQWSGRQESVFTDSTIRQVPAAEILVLDREARQVALA